MSETELLNIRNYRRIDQQLATAGQPQADQFVIIGRHFDCVINLALPDSPGALADEAARVRHAGRDYVHIPVNFKEPAAANLEAFFQTMQARAQQHVFVHCALNWRVSAFVFLYRVIRKEVALSKAYADLQAVWTPNAIWQSFIDSALHQHGYSSPHTDEGRNEH